MLKTVADTNPNRPVTFIHAARNGNVHALRQEVMEIADRSPQVSVYWCYGKPTSHDREMNGYNKEGHIDLPWLQNVISTKEASFYFCGPVPFMKTVNSLLKEWGVAAADIHYEFFGSSGSLEDAEGVQPQEAAPQR